MKSIIRSIILIGIVIFCLFVICKLLLTRKKEKIRYENNIEALLSENFILKTRNGQLASQTRSLRLTNMELEKLLPELKDEIHNLRIKLRRAESISVVSTQITDTLRIPINDKVILTDSLRSFRYKDEFTVIAGNIYKDSIDLNYSVTDSIIQVVHWGKYQKWYHCFTRKRPLIQTITSKNPNTQIKYNKHIIIEKK